MLCPVEGREFFVGPKVLARGNCVSRFDLRPCFLCLHAPKPKRLANAVAVQRPQIATNNGETLALDDCLCGDPLATLADSLRKTVSSSEHRSLFLRLDPRQPDCIRSLLSARTFPMRRLLPPHAREYAVEERAEAEEAEQKRGVEALKLECGLMRQPI